ncbi:hypothetical protein ADUPG1_002070, partial [Aduncisulcus paluster]
MNNYDILVSICYSDTHSAVSNFISGGHPHLLKNFGEFYDHVDSKASIVTKGTKHKHIALLHSVKLSAENLLTGVPLWTTTFLSGIKKKLNSCTKDEELIECADSALRKVVELSPSKVHRGIKDFKFESSLFKTNEKILSAVIFSLIGPGIGSMNHSLGADLVRASCGLVVPYDPRKLYVDAKDVVERCAV